MTSMYEIETMSLYEYGIRMKAHELKQVDEERNNYWIAWLSSRASDTKPAGKDKVVPVYKTFQGFFDYKKRLYDLGDRNETAQEQRLRTVARRVKELEAR